MSATYKSILKKSSKNVVRAMKAERLQHRFNISSHNDKNLRKSLAVIKKLYLLENSILNKDVHKIHADNLNSRFQKQWSKLKSKYGNESQAKEHFRFFTLIDSVSSLNAKSSIKHIIKLKEQIRNTASGITGLWMCGAVECEVINLQLMRKYAKAGKSNNVVTTDDGETVKRKYEVCESLIKRLRTTQRSKSSFFLIHFHGLISMTDGKTMTAGEKFEYLREKFKKCRQWNSNPRQIELKNLSSQWAGRTKSVEKNLEHIAQYITKGGNDWHDGSGYLKYKLDLQDAVKHDEDAWVQANWHSSDVLRKEFFEEGITNSLSMTISEINELTILLNGMMELNKKRTGYLLTIN
jgi:hypothetical protein